MQHRADITVSCGKTEKGKTSFVCVVLLEAFCMPPHSTDGNVPASPSKENYIGLLPKV
jgi:hypothetical protein